MLSSRVKSLSSCVIKGQTRPLLERTCNAYRSPELSLLAPTDHPIIDVRPDIVIHQATGLSQRASVLWACPGKRGLDDQFSRYWFADFWRAIKVRLQLRRVQYLEVRVNFKVR